MSIDLLEEILNKSENEHLECKEAKNRYDFEKLVKYCCALANEGGGKFVLGVTDRQPRQIVGTKAFPTFEKTKAGLVERLHLRIELEEIFHPGGRILVFHVPSRPVGSPIHYKGQYFMRAGEDLVPMLPDVLKRIFDEAGPDFTAEICVSATLDDLDPSAIENFRNLWIKKSGNEILRDLNVIQLLLDAELVVREEVTYAAIILLGKGESLGRLLAQSEVVFEYRSDDTTGPAQDRQEFRQGFFSFYDKLWELINLRNDRQHFQDGLFIWDILTFNEEAVREAILNAVSHRDFRMAGSVFIRQYPRRLEVVSPGGFPPGINLHNVLWEQSPRNRRIAEAFARCGLVERSGQGMNRIFETCIKESKPKPDFTNTDAYHVWLTLHGDVQDPKFLRFLEKLGKEKLSSFTTRDLFVIDFVYRGDTVPEKFKGNLVRLIENGIIEKISRGRGTRYVLSRRFYKFIGKKGAYTRRKGLDRETNKALLVKHISDNNDDGSRFRDLRQVLPSLSQGQLKVLLKEIKQEDKIHCVGSTRAALWHVGCKTDDLDIDLEG